VTTPAPAPAPVDVLAACSEADRFLAAANLADARRIYRELLDTDLSHEQALRVAEGLYRARDFAYALRAFERAGGLRKGEEPYRYYLAVAHYETGNHAAAKKELAAVLPYIEITPDVTRYRTLIENAQD
jgi:tetratricopeptide (TPR) repeat protein